jgi:beta-N-acetylhexosaminidase
VAARIRRRRRLAIGAACGLAAGAFAFGVGLGDGSGPPPSAAPRLGLGQLAGERIVLGFDGSEVPGSVSSAIRSGGAAGVILFSDNLPNRQAARRLIGALQAIPRAPGLRDPLLVMIDQEGGLVKRIGGPPGASARQMGAGGAAFSREQGRRTALNLRNVGVNVDLAPVLDVARPGGTIAETDRGFGSSAGRVTATAVPFAEALQQAGVAATAKHFPGLGSARIDTDFATQRIRLSKQALRQVDEAPYLSFVGIGGGMVMLSTAIYPALSSKPAAFARPIATGELRERLGFEGVSITDALDTVSVKAFASPPAAGMAAARAGTDLLLFTEPSLAASTRQALIRALRTGSLSRSEFETSADRVLSLRGSLASP